LSIRSSFSWPRHNLNKFGSAFGFRKRSLVGEPHLCGLHPDFQSRYFLFLVFSFDSFLLMFISLSLHFANLSAKIHKKGDLLTPLIKKMLNFMSF